jgi:hypothetical protein
VIFTVGFVLATVSAFTFLGGIAAAFLGVPVPPEWALLYFVGLPFGLIVMAIGMLVDR